ncbi:MAG: hypothetical protein HY985_05500 [Magnetospirillum sp.]|nr:hypothetical protein [Magnetospirillum sp.]
MLNPGLVAALLFTAVPASAMNVVGQDSDEDWQPQVNRLIAKNDLAAQKAPNPLRVAMEVCQGTACAEATNVRLSSLEAERIRAVFDPPATSAAEERAQLATAIAFFETFVGARNGTWADLPRNLHPEDAEDEGQMDCVSESTNTRTYLDRLDKAGLIRYHGVGEQVFTYILLLQHIAVEMVDKETGVRWVVDSWEGANGEPPVISTYDDWCSEYHV